MIHPFGEFEAKVGRPRAKPGQGRIPMIVVTGFLGAGKTTLIRKLLETEAGANTALIVNEFGEIGIDDVLLRTADERTVLLGNGCLCCAASTDLHRALRELFADRRRGHVPDFERVIVETSGLADPTPVLQSLASDRALAAQFSLGPLVTVVDAVNARGNASVPEWRKQVALADRLVVTKTEIASAADLAALDPLLTSLAPRALRLGVPGHALDGAEILSPLPAVAEPPREAPAARPHDHDHAGGYTTFTITRSDPIDWPLLQHTLESLATICGPRLLRLKGLVHVRGRPGPVVVHHVQHLAHPPEELRAWPGIEPATRLVLIGIGLDEAKVRALVEAVWDFDTGP